MNMPPQPPFIVTFTELPESVDREELLAYIEDALKSWRGSLSPDDPLSEINPDAIVVEDAIALVAEMENRSADDCAESTSGQVECVCCEHGIGAAVEWEMDRMDKVGWFGHYVCDIPGTQYINAHTHMLDKTFGHLDLQVVLPGDRRVVDGVIAAVVSRIKDGAKFEDGDVVSDIVPDGYDLKFVAATESGRPVLRILIPDVENRFGSDCEDALYAGQAEAEVD